jgi:hypothetical protein
MSHQNPVEIADRLSRRRAFGVAAAALVFLAAQLVSRGPDRVHLAGIDLWAVNAAVLLLLFASGGALMYGGRVRSLLNDVVSRSNYRTAVLAGYWTAMGLAMALYVIAGNQPLTARDAVYAIVTGSVVVSLLTFAYLEYRANQDA